jgi:hypothetical protein
MSYISLYTLPGGISRFQASYVYLSLSLALVKEDQYVAELQDSFLSQPLSGRGPKVSNPISRQSGHILLDCLDVLSFSTT